MKHQLLQGTLSVEVPTDLLSTTIEPIREGLRSLLELPEITTAAPRTLCLDLRRCKLMDSAGVNLLVGLIRNCQMRGLKLAVRIVSQPVYRILLFTRLDRHLEVSMED